MEINLEDRNIGRLVQTACHYCGLQPKWPKVHGIDRKDNTVGYVHNNCVPSCKDCNFMKGTLGYVYFIRKCNEIAQIHPRKA